MLSRLQHLRTFPPVILDVLPGGSAQALADHPAVGLHPQRDRAESALVDGGNPFDAVRGLIRAHHNRHSAVFGVDSAPGLNMDCRVLRPRGVLPAS